MIRLIVFLILVSSFPFQLLTAEKSIKFSGVIVFDKINAKFKLINLDEDDYELVITTPDTDSSCSFKVTRITAPQQMRGRNGVLFSNRDDGCLFNGKTKEETTFWNKIVLIDFNYRFSSTGKLEGKASLKGLESTSIGTLIFD